MIFFLLTKQFSLIYIYCIVALHPLVKSYANFRIFYFEYFCKIHGCVSIYLICLGWFPYISINILYSNIHSNFPASLQMYYFDKSLAIVCCYFSWWHPLWVRWDGISYRLDLDFIKSKNVDVCVCARTHSCTAHMCVYVGHFYFLGLLT